MKKIPVNHEAVCVLKPFFFPKYYRGFIPISLVEIPNSWKQGFIPRGSRRSSWLNSWTGGTFGPHRSVVLSPGLHPPKIKRLPLKKWRNWKLYLSIPFKRNGIQVFFRRLHPGNEKHDNGTVDPFEDVKTSDFQSDRHVSFPGGSVLVYDEIFMGI